MRSLDGPPNQRTPIGALTSRSRDTRVLDASAFSCVQYHLEKLDARVLFRLLSDMMNDGNDKPGHYKLEEYYVEKAFKHITSSPELTLEQKAGLEFAYIDALAHSWRDGENQGIPNLERYVELHPEVFVQAIVWAYKRNDDGTDPPDLSVTPERSKDMAERGYKLLQGLERMPGHNDLDELEAVRLSQVKFCLDR